MNTNKLTNDKTGQKEPGENTQRISTIILTAAHILNAHPYLSIEFSERLQNLNQNSSKKECESIYRTLEGAEALIKSFISNLSTLAHSRQYGNTKATQLNNLTIILHELLIGVIKRKRQSLTACLIGTEQVA